MNLKQAGKPKGDEKRPVFKGIVTKSFDKRLDVV